MYKSFHNHIEYTIIFHLIHSFGFIHFNFVCIWHSGLLLPSIFFFSSSFVAAIWFLSRFFLCFFFRRLLTFSEFLVPKCDYGCKKDMSTKKKMSTKVCKEWKIPNWMRTKMPTNNTKKTEDKICKHSLTYPSTKHIQHTYTHVCFHSTSFLNSEQRIEIDLLYFASLPTSNYRRYFLFFFFSFSSVVCRTHPKAPRFRLWFILVYLLQSLP